MPSASMWVGVFWRLRSEGRDKSPLGYHTVAEAPLRKKTFISSGPGSWRGGAPGAKSLRTRETFGGGGTLGANSSY